MWNWVRFSFSAGRETSVHKPGILNAQSSMQLWSDMIWAKQGKAWSIFSISFVQSIAIDHRMNLVIAQITSWGLAVEQVMGGFTVFKIEAKPLKDLIRKTWACSFAQMILEILICTKHLQPNKKFPGFLLFCSRRLQIRWVPCIYTWQNHNSYLLWV